MTSSVTINKSHIVVAQNASGRNMNVPVYRLTGQQPGPTVYIQSSIHGSEVQGNVVIYQLMQYLKQLQIAGEIILVPNCNPVGTNIKAGEYTLGRFDPVNGTNWNRGYYYDPDRLDEFYHTVQDTDCTATIKAKFRQFWRVAITEKLESAWGLGLAQQLNLKLQLLALDADIVLDLHNGPVSTRHIYIPQYAAKSAGLFNIPHVIFIPNHFAGALDEATFCPWWTLQEKLSTARGTNIDLGVEAMTLEMGSQEVIAFEEGKQDAQSILAYLGQRGVINQCPFEPAVMQRVGVHLSQYKTLFTQWGGMVEYMAKPGQRVAKGQPLARVLNIDELDNEQATFTIYAPCDMIPILHFPSASVLSGTQLYKVFTEYFDITGT